MKSSLKTLIAVGALALAATQASASTYTDTTTNAFDVKIGTEENYIGTVDAGGVDTWYVTLLGPAGLTISNTTSQDNLPPIQVLGKAELWQGTTFISSAMATVAPVGTQGAMESSIYMEIANLLLPTTYTLKIFGDAGAAYSGTVSAVPLPGAALLFGSALLGMAGLRRKQKSELVAA
jgi:hypothetical protein